MTEPDLDSGNAEVASHRGSALSNNLRPAKSRLRYPHRKQRSEVIVTTVTIVTGIGVPIRIPKKQSRPV